MKLGHNCKYADGHHLAPLGLPILVPAGVLSGARQHICTFVNISWHRWPKIGKWDSFPIYRVVQDHMPPEYEK